MNGRSSSTQSETIVINEVTASTDKSSFQTSIAASGTGGYFHKINGEKTFITVFEF